MQFVAQPFREYLYLDLVDVPVVGHALLWKTFRFPHPRGPNSYKKSSSMKGKKQNQDHQRVRMIPIGQGSAVEDTAATILSYNARILQVRPTTLAS